MEEGVFEKALETADQIIEFYLPHTPKFWKEVETTKLRVVYNASARPQPVLRNKSKITKSFMRRSCSSPIFGSLSLGSYPKSLLPDQNKRNRAIHPVFLLAIKLAPSSLQE